MRSAVNKCIISSLSITNENKKIKHLISELASKTDLTSHNLRERFVQSKIGKEMYKCRGKPFITKNMRAELKLIHKVLSTPKKYSLETPIAHIIHRELDFTLYGDAFLEAGGAFVQNVFWWHTEWLKEIKALTPKKYCYT